MLESIAILFNLVKSTWQTTRTGLNHHQEKLHLLQDEYVMDAIGETCCLSPDDHEPETISFDTVQRRVHLEQKHYPEKAKHSGIPSPDDPQHAKALRDILKRLEKNKRLKPAKHQDRWKKAE